MANRLAGETHSLALPPIEGNRLLVLASNQVHAIKSFIHRGEFMKPNRYHPATVFFHWVIFLLFVVALATIEYRGYLPKGDPLKDSIVNIHMLAGQLVFLFVLFRVAARFRFG